MVSFESREIQKKVSFLLETNELWQQTLNWQPTLTQQEQFQQLHDLIVAGNRHLNLTRITDPQQFWEKHLWDSLRAISPWLPTPHTPHPTPHTPFTAIDIGTGGGFPGIPIAIAHPDWTLTLLDSTRKKLDFLDTVIAALKVENAKTWVDRAEEVGQHPDHRAHYDLALIRAVATAPVCAEYALPLLKKGGVAILYRGQWTDEENQALEAAVAQLGGTIEAIDSFSTPLTQGLRHCIHLKKIKSTPAQFPRPVGIPTQRPIA